MYNDTDGGATTDIATAADVGDSVKHQSFFKKVSFGVFIIILFIMMYFGPTLSGTAAWNTCAQYRYNRHGDSTCVKYESKEVSAKWNILWYIFLPLLIGATTGMIVSCAKYPKECKSNSIRGRRRYQPPVHYSLINI